MASYGPMPGLQHRNSEQVNDNYEGCASYGGTAMIG